MADTKINPNEELLPSSFKFHDFSVEVGESKIACQVIKMQDSIYLWVGNSNEKAMNDLAFTFMSPYESIPVVTKLMGSHVDSTSGDIAKRLTKKCGKPVYVSFNVAADKFKLPGIEKGIHDEFKAHPEIWA